jgi:ATP/ADP translocase
VLDTSLRYTVDKTTREILFLPLPLDAQVPGQAVHRRHGGPLGQGLGALILLVLISRGASASTGSN